MKTINKHFFGLVIILFTAMHVNAAVQLPNKITGAKIFDRESNGKELLYQLDRKETTVQGKRTVEDIFKDPKGNVVAVETFIYQGEDLKSYQSQHHQTEIDGKVTLDGKAVTFTLGSKTWTEDFEPNVISKNQIVSYLHKNWDSLMTGETIPIRLLVVDRGETVGFKFFKIEEATVQDKKVVIVKMKPSSFVIAALVDPLIFTFEKDAFHKLLEVSGRVVPKKHVDNEWKDLDAVTVYQY